VSWLEHLANWLLSGFLSAYPLKFIGLSGVPPDCTMRQWINDQLHPMVDCADCGAVCSTEVRSQPAKSEYTGLSGVPPDCLMPQEDRRLQLLTAPNPNGRLTWHSPDTEQCSVRCTTGLSGVLIDNNDRNSGWDYKYPQPPPFKPSKLLTLLIQYKSKEYTLKTQSKHSILSKFQNQVK
jgi:hypothetical protein